MDDVSGGGIEYRMPELRSRHGVDTMFAATVALVRHCTERRVVPVRVEHQMPRCSEREYEAFYFIADYHALTAVQDPAALRHMTYDVAATWLALGLDLPERRVGLSAHDFAQLLGSREVILSRAAKLGGAPTVASRFTQRLAAVAGARHWKDALARGEKYLAWARDLDRGETITPAKRPRPMPPLNARPRILKTRTRRRSAP